MIASFLTFLAVWFVGTLLYAVLEASFKVLLTVMHFKFPKTVKAMNNNYEACSTGYFVTLFLLFAFLAKRLLFVTVLL